MTDVLVVGAGPSGLLLAGDLAEAGHAVTVLERRPATETRTTRAFAVHARTLELLDIRGVVDQLLESGRPVRTIRFLAGAEMDLSTLDSKFNYVLVTPQYNVETVLLERAERFDAKIELGAEVVDLTQSTHGVNVRLSDGSTRSARYLVGADGMRSMIRDLVGLPFPGKTVQESVMLADVRFTEPPPDALTGNASEAGVAFVAPFGDGWYRVFAWNRHHEVPDTEPVDFEEVRTIVRSALGTDFGMHDPRWLSRFRSDERQVPSYRAGRVFLAGDAAHCHSPAGGMGMNTGLQDSANLSWKLSAVLKGQMSERLLDTYQDERHPVGKQVLRVSGAILRGGMVSSPVARRLREIVGGFVLRQRPMAIRLARTISAIGTHYGKATRVPDMPLTNGRLYEALRGSRFVLVANDQPSGIPDHIHVVKPITPTARPILVRPDGYRAPLSWSVMVTANRPTDPAPSG